METEQIYIEWQYRIIYPSPVIACMLWDESQYMQLFDDLCEGYYIKIIQNLLVEGAQNMFNVGFVHA